MKQNFHVSCRLCKTFIVPGVDELIRHRTISVPLPTHRLALSALRALSVDAELSPLVRRCLSLASLADGNGKILEGVNSEDFEPRLNGNAPSIASRGTDETLIVLRTQYKATTNRMLRVAVNGFMESLGIVLGVMEELDIDVLVEGDLAGNRRLLVE